jgi:hypothetical protein
VNLFAPEAHERQIDFDRLVFLLYNMAYEEGKVIEVGFLLGQGGSMRGLGIENGKRRGYIDEYR